MLAAPVDAYMGGDFFRGSLGGYSFWRYPQLAANGLSIYGIDEPLNDLSEWDLQLFLLSMKVYIIRCQRVPI